MKNEIKIEDVKLLDQACCTNYGTDGGVCWLQKGTLSDGTEVRIMYLPTDEYNDHQEKWHKFEKLEHVETYRDLHGDEAAELEELRADEDFQNNISFFESEENACDWDNPESIEVL